MPWWGWMVLGATLLAVEMLLIDLQFYLVFVGVAAALVGLLVVIGIGLPDAGQWFVFAILALASMFSFRRRLYEKLRGTAGPVDARLNLGDRVAIANRLEPGATCRVDYRGTTWNARNEGELAIEAGQEAEICRIDGITLHVRNPQAS